MGSLLVQVAIYGLAAAFAAPIAIVVTALILGRSKRPVPSGWTFVAGAAFLDVLFAVVVLASGIFDSSGDAGAIVDVGLGILFGVMGVFAVFSEDSPEKDAARRARAEQIATAKLSALFLAGILVQVINFDAMPSSGARSRTSPRRTSPRVKRSSPRRSASRSCSASTTCRSWPTWSLNRGPCPSSVA